MNDLETRSLSDTGLIITCMPKNLFSLYNVNLNIMILSILNLGISIKCRE